MICPLTASHYGPVKETPEDMAQWCRRAVKIKDQTCQRCELRQGYGVAMPGDRAEKNAPVQGRMF